MIRAIPQDIGTLAASEELASANPSFWLFRWHTFGEEWSFGIDQEETRDRTYILQFAFESPVRAQVEKKLRTLQFRQHERAKGMQERGYTVHLTRLMCAGQVVPTRGDPVTADVGLTIDRNTGLPHLPASQVLRALRAGADVAEGWPSEIASDEAQRTQLIHKLYGNGNGVGGSSVTVFEAFPSELPSMARRPVHVVMGTPPPAPPAPGVIGAPDLVLSVARTSEFDFLIAARDAADADLALRHLEVGLTVLGLAKAPVEEVEPVSQPVQELEELPEPAAEATELDAEYAEAYEEQAVAEAVDEQVIAAAAPAVLFGEAVAG